MSELFIRSPSYKHILKMLRQLNAKNFWVLKKCLVRFHVSSTSHLKIISKSKSFGQSLKIHCWNWETNYFSSMLLRQWIIKCPFSGQFTSTNFPFKFLWKVKEKNKCKVISENNSLPSKIDVCHLPSFIWQIPVEKIKYWMNAKQMNAKLKQDRFLTSFRLL